MSSSKSRFDYDDSRHIEMKIKLPNFDGYLKKKIYKFIQKLKYFFKMSIS